MALFRASRLFDVLRKSTTPLLSLEEPLSRSWNAWETATIATTSISSKPSCYEKSSHPRWGTFSRGLCTGLGQGPPVSNTEAAQLLRSISAFDLRGRLEALSEDKLYMSYGELLREVQDSSAGLDEQGAEELCKALIKAGVVLQYRDVIYLRPEEVAEMVLGNLPHKQGEVENKLATLRKRLGPLIEVKNEIRDEARTRSAMYLNAGLLFLVSQFGIFYWLTFHELSWDVMEPVAYFFTLGYGILTYVYFLVQREDFDYLGFRKRVETEHETKEERKRNFDEILYKKLTRDVERYERYLERFKVEAVALRRSGKGFLKGPDDNSSQAAMLSDVSKL